MYSERGGGRSTPVRGLLKVRPKVLSEVSIPVRLSETLKLSPKPFSRLFHPYLYLHTPTGVVPSPTLALHRNSDFVLFPFRSLYPTPYHYSLSVSQGDPRTSPRSSLDPSTPLPVILPVYIVPSILYRMTPSFVGNRHRWTTAPGDSDSSRPPNPSVSVPLPSTCHRYL